VAARESPLDLSDRAAIEDLGEVLHAAGFTGEGVRDTLGVSGQLVSRTIDIPLHVRRAREHGARGTLVRLLVLDVAVPADAAREAFAPLRLERLEGMGVVRRDGGEVCPLVRIVPHDEVLVASDRRLTAGGEMRADHVAGVHGPSRTLAHLTVRRSVETTLDVAAGCGIQAILASAHSGRVVATDLNRRALCFASFNAALNGCDNVEVRAGSLFEPVEGCRFGLVTCNPPYVISPESALMFRDSGMEGDAVSRELVRRAPGFLEEGAFASVLVSWANEGDDATLELRRWVEGSGCDAWLLYYGTDDPLSHAGKWLRDERTDPGSFDTAVDQWLAYFQRLGIESVSYGAVVLRRRSGGSNWTRADRMAPDRLAPAGEHILRVFAAGDFLGGLADERALLAERLTLAGLTQLEQRVVYRDREWAVADASATIGDGLRFHATLDRPTTGLLAALDGERTLGDVADELARLEGASPAAVEQSVLPIAREMLAAGFLVRR
jgi:Methyltransferase small domain